MVAQQISSVGTPKRHDSCDEACASSHASSSGLMPEHCSQSSTGASPHGRASASIPHKDADRHHEEASSTKPVNGDMDAERMRDCGRHGSPVPSHHHLHSPQAQSAPGPAPATQSHSSLHAAGKQLHAISPKSPVLCGKAQGSARHRGYANWLGDFGHLDGPKFSKQASKAWQAHMHELRDHPSAAGDADNRSESNQDEVHRRMASTNACHECKWTIAN